MSLVGPRPLPIKDFECVRDEDHLSGHYRRRALAKPGMTGLWQVSGRSELGFREMVLLDVYYVEHQTLLLDLEILAQTVPAVLSGRGAY
jgi:lipopolysaccharide/colanic/teichoic acid biosynthesis glycosyltransferase